MREVASAARVSVATVSRVLSGSDRRVDPELAARVRTAAERLGYSTNRLARGLRRQTTETIGMVVPDIANPFFPAVIKAVETEARSVGLTLLLCDSGNDVAQEADALRRLVDHQIDGMIISVCDRIASRQAVAFTADRLPLVQIDRQTVGGSGYLVGVDQVDSVNRILRHLREQGYRRYAYITAGLEISTARQRLEAFVAHLRSSDPGVERRVLVGEFSIEWGYEATRRLLEAGSGQDEQLPDALVCADDLIAVGAVQCLRQRGIRVPDEVAVTGFDDTVLATASRPQLTTVRQPLDLLGRAAVGLLRRAIQEPRMPARSTVLPAELVVRESSVRSNLPAKLPRTM